jgi:hypothetical protein
MDIIAHRCDHRITALAGTPKNPFSNCTDFVFDKNKSQLARLT